MLVSLQFPIADVRPFVDGDTGRLKKPEWPQPKLQDRQFVRGFGRVMRRRRGGLSGWPGEDYYCDVRRALVFRDTMPRGADTGAERIFMKPVYRRFHATGSVVARFEVGFACQTPDDSTVRLSDRWTRAGLASAVEALYSLKVRPWGFSDDRPLIAVGKKLAQAYLKASTATGLTGDGPRDWWVSVGMPAAFIELRRRPEDFGTAIEWQPPVQRRPRRPWEVFDGDGHEDVVGIRFTRFRVDDFEIPTWVQWADHDYATDWRRLDVIARQARIRVLRLHNEIECAREVTRLLMSGDLRLRRPSNRKENASGRLSYYLENVAKLLTSEKTADLRHSSVFDAIAMTSINEAEEIETLLASLSEAKHSVSRQFRELARRNRTKIIVRGGQAIIAERLEHAEQTVNDKSIRVGDQSHVGSAVQIDNMVNSTIGQSGPSKDMEESLTELRDLVNKLIQSGKLDPDEQSRVQRSYDGLAHEASAAKPDRAWYSLSAEGLKSAAANVASIAPAILTVVDKIVGLIGGKG